MCAENELWHTVIMQIITKYKWNTALIIWVQSILGVLWKTKCPVENHGLSTQVRKVVQKIRRGNCYCLAVLVFQTVPSALKQCSSSIPTTVSENYCCCPRASEVDGTINPARRHFLNFLYAKTCYISELLTLQCRSWVINVHHDPRKLKIIGTISNKLENLQGLSLSLF